MPICNYRTENKNLRFLWTNKYRIESKIFVIPAVSTPYQRFQTVDEPVEI